MKWALSCLLLILVGWFVMPTEVLAASCPYCGRVYGEPAPGDEARVYALRREHERTCPSRPRNGNGNGGLIGFGSVGSQRTTPRPPASSPGRTTRPEPPPPITNPIGSVIGNGSGTADSATNPSSASGSFSLSAITPPSTRLPTGATGRCTFR